MQSSMAPPQKCDAAVKDNNISSLPKYLSSESEFLSFLSEFIAKRARRKEKHNNKLITCQA